MIPGLGKILIATAFLGMNVEASEYDFEYLTSLSLEELISIKITTGSKKSESISSIPGSVIIITRSEIEDYGYGTLEEILESIPGLYQIDVW